MKNLTKFTKYNSNSPEFYIDTYRDYFDKKLILTLETTKRKLDIYMLKDLANKDKIKKQKAYIKNLNTMLNRVNLCLKKSNKEIQRKEEYIKELNELVESLKQSIDEINEAKEEMLKELKRENNQLKNEVDKNKKKKNSTNSSLPPSSDFASLHIYNSRKKTDRKIGGQKGHVGHFAKLTNPDTIIEKRVKKAPTGATAIFDDNGNIKYFASQLIDYKLEKKVIEYRYFIDDSKEELSISEMDKFKISSICYGKNIKTIALLFMLKGNVPLKRLALILNEITKGQLNVKESTLCNWQRELFYKTKEDRNKILGKLSTSKLLHLDETSSRNNGKNIWIQVATSNDLAYFFLPNTRGDNKSGCIDFFKNYNNYLIHDHFKPYYSYISNAIHSECGAHILRYLQFGYEIEGSKECKDMIDLLTNTLHERKELIKVGINSFSKEKLKQIEKSYDEIIKKENEKSKYNKVQKKYEPSYVKLFKRMQEYKSEHLRFANDFNVPFDNNAAERICRKVKNKKKTSTQFKTKRFVEYYFGCLSVIETLSLQKKNIASYINSVL